MAAKKKYIILGLVGLLGLIVLFHPVWLSLAGRFPVLDEPRKKSDLAVVLNTGVEIYPRLMAAAELYRQEWVGGVAVNGNRKSDTLREMERMGLRPCCPWYEDHLRILALLGVPRTRVVVIAAEDAYDTVSEAERVGRRLLATGTKSILLVTSKYHTRRAGFIWKRLYGDRLAIRVVAAKNDPFTTEGWWRDGRQIRWLLAEYGAWGFYWWKRLLHGGSRPGGQTVR
jgi:uncharacterized SAM-binding protein YcdF (DUF218 family)